MIETLEAAAELAAWMFAGVLALIAGYAVWDHLDHRWRQKRADRGP